MAEDPAAVSEGGEERLPWLQRTELDTHVRRPGRRLPLLGGLGLIVLLLALGLFAFRPHRGPSPTDALDSNLVPPDQQNLIAPAPPVPSNGQVQAPAEGRHRGRHHQPSPASQPGAVAAHHGARADQRAAGTGTHPRRTVAPQPAASRPTAAARRQQPNAAVHGARRQPVAHPRQGFVNGRGEVVQLGAFASREAAEHVWQKQSRTGRFAAAGHRVERARVHGHIFYRLRVQVPAAREVCSPRLERRGRCIVISH